MQAKSDFIVSLSDTSVMATGVATRLIHTGQMITVDGDTGVVSTEVSRT